MSKSLAYERGQRDAQAGRLPITGASVAYLRGYQNALTQRALDMGAITEKPLEPPETETASARYNAGYADAIAGRLPVKDGTRAYDTGYLDARAELRKRALSEYEGAEGRGGLRDETDKGRADGYANLPPQSGRASAYYVGYADGLARYEREKAEAETRDAKGRGLLSKDFPPDWTSEDAEDYAGAPTGARKGAKTRREKGAKHNAKARRTAEDAEDEDAPMPDYAPTPRAGRRARYPEPTEDAPTMDDLQDMMLDGDCYATDGCLIEPDGICSHGHVSWLRYMGIV